MSIEIADIILLLASAQGFFLTALIFHKHRPVFANRFLGSLIFLYSILLFHLLFFELGYAKAFPLLTLMMLGVSYLIPPLHYLYAKYMVRDGGEFRQKDWLHFSPFIIYECYGLLRFYYSAGDALALLRSDNTPPSIEAIVFNWALLVVGFAYMTLTIVTLNRYARRAKNVFSSSEKIMLDWLRNITFMACGVWGVFLLENVLLLGGIDFSNNFTLSSALTAVYVYALGYLGLFKSEVFAASEIAASMNRVSEDQQSDDVERKTPASTQKYEKSGLTEEKAEQTHKRLLALMEEGRPYTNSNLTLNQLAEMLEASSHNLSEVINTRLGQNFFDFVNHYRVEHVKNDLLDPQKQHLKVLAIALDAGFSSKSSFNAIFKKHTQLTPSQYRKQAAESTAS